MAPARADIIQVRRSLHHEVLHSLLRSRPSLCSPRTRKSDSHEISRHRRLSLLRRVHFRHCPRPDARPGVCIYLPSLAYPDRLFYVFLSTYVDQHTAQEHNITHATDNSFVLRADYTTYLTPSDPGRRSARIVSRRQFTTVVAVYVGQLGVIRHTIPDYICIASTYFTCHKDAGELLLNGLVMLMCLIKYI